MLLGFLASWYFWKTTFGPLTVPGGCLYLARHVVGDALALGLGSDWLLVAGDRDKGDGVLSMVWWLP